MTATFRHLYRSIPCLPAAWRAIYREWCKVKSIRRKRADFRRLIEAAHNGTLLNDLPDEQRLEWERRIRKVVSDPNNQTFNPQKNAGRIVRGNLIMHNGLKVHPLSHYGPPMLQLLVENRSIHEPEEERAFSLVLPFIKPGSTMIELGSYWAFYSMWFLKEVKNSNAILVEPNPHNIEWGRTNLSLNRLSAPIIQSYIGSAPPEDPNATPTKTVNELAREFGLEKINLLHADIQGAELEMLRGARALLSNKEIDFIFLSTHSNPLHHSCADLLLSHDYTLFRNTDIDATFCVDGIIVASHPDAPGFNDLTAKFENWNELAPLNT